MSIFSRRFLPLICLGALFCTGGLVLEAHAGDPDGSAEGLYIHLKTRGMRVLMLWALLNLVIGGVGAALSRSKPTRIFLGSNAAWNLVNLALALVGLWEAQTLGGLAGVDLIRELVFFQKVLLVNVGLDAGYVGIGGVLFLWGREKADPWRRSIGAALVVQGVFLLGFDLLLSLFAGEQLDVLWRSLGSS